MKVVLWFLMMFMPLMANASSINEEQLFHRLDSYIAQRSKFTQRKEAKLLRLKKQLYMTSDKRSQLRLYNQIYREYYTYRYDSAMTYAKKGYQLAAQLQDDYFINLNKINRAAVLSTGGFYSQAEDLMLAMDVEKMSPKLLQYYYSSNPQPIGFSGILLAKRQNSFYCTYFLHNRNVADTKSPYPIKRLEVIRWFNQKSMVFNQSLS